MIQLPWKLTCTLSLHFPIPNLHAHMRRQEKKILSVDARIMTPNTYESASTNVKQCGVISHISNSWCTCGSKDKQPTWHSCRHTCTLAEALTHLHCVIHNHMTIVCTYLHSHPHTYFHFWNTHTFTCLLIHLHTHTKTHTSAQILFTWICDLIISPFTSWLSQFLYYNANIKICLRIDYLTLWART